MVPSAGAHLKLKENRGKRAARGRLFFAGGQAKSAGRCGASRRGRGVPLTSGGALLRGGWEAMWEKQQRFLLPGRALPAEREQRKKGCQRAALFLLGARAKNAGRCGAARRGRGALPQRGGETVQEGSSSQKAGRLWGRGRTTGGPRWGGRFAGRGVAGSGTAGGKLPGDGQLFSGFWGEQG